ncbi:MAG TPA: HNH endonuclease family protein [Microthrixaceae bacterium]|nr:HNH endonuclease family protein [Microthrixaceae bacterium]
MKSKPLPLAVVLIAALFVMQRCPAARDLATRIGHAGSVKEVTESISIPDISIPELSLPTLPTAPAQPSEPTPPLTATATATQLLEALPVAEPITAGYTRESFKHWSDLDNDCFDARQQVLRDESTSQAQVDVGSYCTVVAGDWVSIYDGKEFTDPGELDVDHFVPLSEAWKSGANTWDAGRREAYANDVTDPGHLVAVSATSNRSKGDKDPARWLPPVQETRCWYVENWVSVKTRWGLSVDAAEKSAIARTLEAC